MKTSELKKIFEDNGFDLDDTKEMFEISSLVPKVIAQAILDYAYTPLEEREEEKKYRLKSKLIEFESERHLYLINSNLLKKYCLSTNSRQSFTQEEIDAMPFDTNFFIKEEVNND